MRKCSLLIVSVLLPLSAVCQIPQSSPQFCGTGVTAVALPTDIAPVFNEKGATLVLRTGGPAIHLRLDDWSIDQMCPLPGGRVAAFGFTGNGTTISLLDPARSVLVDEWISYDPVISPDGRWIVYSKYFPRNTEEPASSEYLLYDLTKTPLQNRPSGQDSPTDLGFDVGAAIYPVGWKNESLDNIGAPKEQQHGMGKAFWTPDSKEILFSDNSVAGRFIVIVSIDDNGATSALVHPVSETQPCVLSDNAQSARSAHWDDLAHVDFGPRQASERILFVDFATEGCKSATQQFRRSEFSPAPIEKRIQEIPTRKTIPNPGPSRLPR
jgi:hypothetical protein